MEYGFSCSGEKSICTTTCGDGQRAITENCDDNNLGTNDGCSDTCTIEMNGHCDLTVNPNLCDICGNSVRKPPELCDDGT